MGDSRVAAIPDGSRYALVATNDALLRVDLASGSPAGLADRSAFALHARATQVVALWVGGSPEGAAFDYGSPRALGDIPTQDDYQVALLTGQSEVLAAGEGDFLGTWTVGRSEMGSRATPKAARDTHFVGATSRVGGAFALSVDDGEVVYFDGPTSTGQRLVEPGDGSEVSSLTFSPSGESLVVGRSSGHLRIWNLDGRPTTGPTLSVGDVITAIHWLQAGDALLLGTQGGQIQLYSTGNGLRPVGPTSGASESPSKILAVRAAGNTIHAVDSRGRILAWAIPREVWSLLRAS